MTIRLLLAAALFAAPAPPATTANLDLGRYLGKWYELARYDHFFERGCAGVTATYAVEGDHLRVENTCLKGGLDGPRKSIRGKAWVPDRRAPGKLKVQFFWPFSADYWVLEVADDYAWALVGDGDREHCWILGRSPVMEEALYARLVEKLRARGYDPRKLIRVPQRPP